VLNTTFAEADWIIRAAPMQYRISVNYTDQRTVGEQLIAGAPYETAQVAARLAASYCDATLLVAGSATGRRRAAGAVRGFRPPCSIS
jgi:hypothetical protein